MNIKIKKYLPYILWVIVFVMFAVTRIWRLETIPYGYHIDEAGMAYDAWCLSEYGVDRHLKSYPLYLMNFGSGQSALYAYLTAFLFKLFGFHPILIRIPAVAFSLLTLIFGSLLVQKIYPKQPYMAWGTGALITICPYFILASRFGLDCNLMLGASTMFLYFFACAIKEGKYKDYLAAGFAGGLVLYTYALSYFILPIFLIIVFIYILKIKHLDIRKWIAMAVPMGFLAFPLIIIQLINMFDLPEITIGVFTLTKLDSYRNSEILLPDIKNVLTVFINIFWGDDLVSNSIPGFPNLYVISIPLGIIGLIHIFHKTIKNILKNVFDMTAIILAWFLAVFFVMLILEPNVGRMNSIYFTIVIFIMDAISFVLPEKGKIGFVYKTTIIAIYAMFFLNFTIYYYMGEFTKEHYQMGYFDISVSEGIAFIEEHPEYGPNGVYMAQRPIWYALSSLTSPYDVYFAQANVSGVIDDYYYCGTLADIEDGFFYIVRDIYADYAENLRTAGFTEHKYTNYSLFYKNDFN